MNQDQLCPEDMSNLFRYFKIPKSLYSRWKDFAKSNNKSMISALAMLLHSCLPGVYYTVSQNDYKWWNAKHTDPDTMEFPLQYSNELQKEIFNVFMQTGYKNQTMEMNKEILERLDAALSIARY